MGLVDNALNDLQNRRDNLLAGNINSIPSPFPRFRSNGDFIGIQQAVYQIVTSQTKGGKSQFSSFMYIYTPLLYAYRHPEQLDVHILYIPLEETQLKVTQRFMSYLLYNLSNGKYEYSPSELRSTANVPIPQEVIDILKSDEYQKILKFFESRVHFLQESPNPTGLYKACVDWAKSRGKITYKTLKYQDGQEHEVFDNFEWNNPKEYNIIILDHLRLLDEERGLTTKKNIDKMSEYFCKYLRDRYKFTCIAIQQQSGESDGMEAQKMGKPQVSLSTLGDSKYSAHDAEMVLGLFDPARYGIKEYYGYDITKFKDKIRFLQVLSNRDGQMGGVCPLYFNGKTCTYKELPLPGTPELQKWYDWLAKK